MNATEARNAYARPEFPAIHEEARRTLVDELHGIVGLHVLREHQDAHAWMLGPDLASGAEAFVRVGGWHADVDDRHVWPSHPHRVEQCFCVSSLGDHGEPGIGE